MNKPRWTESEELNRLVREFRAKESEEAPWGRTGDGTPAIPTVSLRGSYHNADGVDLQVRLPEKQHAKYQDPSQPHERRGWFFFGEDNKPYSPDGVWQLEDWFSRAILADESPANLLNIYDDVKGCERLPAAIKENLLFNIRSKLQWLASGS